jgi:hypothetical protein
VVRDTDVLRTVIEQAADGEREATRGHYYKQRVLPLAEVTGADMLGTLPPAGLAQDISSLQRALEEAIAVMDVLPPVRLLITTGADPTAYLAASRLLLDHWSMQILANDLAMLYSTGAYASKRLSFVPQRHTRSSFIREMKRLGASPPSGEDEDMGLKLEDLEMGWRPQEPMLPVTKQPLGSSQACTLQLAPHVSAALSIYCVKRNVAPWSALFSAYVQALSERSVDKRVSVLVDLDQPAAHTDALGPVCLPFPMTVASSEAMSSGFVDTVGKRAQACLAKMHLPSRDMDACSSHLSSSLPIFTYRDDTSGVQTVGVSMQPQAAVSMTATASLGQGNLSMYVLRFRTATGCGVQGDGFADAVKGILEQVCVQGMGEYIHTAQKSTHVMDKSDA